MDVDVDDDEVERGLIPTVSNVVSVVPSKSDPGSMVALRVTLQH